MVQVSRDKMRHGEVKEVLNSRTCGVQFDASSTVVYYDLDKITSVGEVEPSVVDSAVKHDTGKNRLELIPVSGIEGIGRAMTFGAKKYAAHNWANGFDYSRLIGSAMRHLLAWMSGQDKDSESGLSHLDHLGACVVMLIAHETEGLGNDDRRKAKTNN